MLGPRLGDLLVGQACRLVYTQTAEDLVNRLCKSIVHGCKYAGPGLQLDWVSYGQAQEQKTKRNGSYGRFSVGSGLRSYNQHEAKA